jgi:hypothetical protein
MRRCAALLSLLPALGLLGCQSTLPSCETPAAVVHADYALVEYRLGEESGAAPKLSISDTETYRNEHGRYGSAALRLPDSCLKDGVTKDSAGSMGSSGALRSECSAWLSEIERALSGAGLRVMAWDAVFRLEQEKNLSTYGAAKELGADVVFVFNGLEAGSVTAGSVKLPKQSYFESDEHGKRGAPLTLDEQTRSAFLKYTSDAAAKSVKSDEVILLSTVLDATAIVSATGESIWFYRRVATRPTEAKQGLRFLFGRIDGGGWTPAAPTTESDTAPAPPTTLTAPVDPGDGGAPPADGFDAERLELVRAGAEHFVQAWKSGELGASEPTDTTEGDR